MEGKVHQLEDLTAPLVIGVTGHRDLRPDDVERLKGVVRGVLGELKAEYPSTPMVMLSPLAEGADRLVAEVALEMGARLVVPLPMPQEMYEKDFQSPESLAQFRRLLARAEHCISMPEPPDGDPGKSGAMRDRPYEAVGMFVARESQILVALWDGVESDKVGGTAKVVRIQLQGVPGKDEHDLQLPELFPVYRIVTPRLSNPVPVGVPFTVEKRYPQWFQDEESAEEYYRQLFGNLEEFNKDICRGGKALVKNARQSKKTLLGSVDEAGFSQTESLDLERYAVTDALAQICQSRRAWTEAVLHWLVFIGFVCFVLFTHQYEHPQSLLLVSLAVLGGAVLFFEYHTRSRQHESRKSKAAFSSLVFIALVILGFLTPAFAPEKRFLGGLVALVGLAYFFLKYAGRRWLAGKGQDFATKSEDYRAIAEGSRVRLFWHMAGIRESVAENYLGKQRTELDWIRNGLRGWELETHMANAGPLPAKERLQRVKQLWIEAQVEYFGDAVESREKKHARIETIIQVCVALFVLAAPLMMFAQNVGYRLNHPRLTLFESLVILADILLVSAALLHHYSRQKAYPEHVKQFKRMETVFRKGSGVIDKGLDAENLDAVRECFRKLGREALSENGDWVLLHREHPLEFPPP